MSEEPKYTDSQFALIMRKASELQERPGRVVAGQGLSLAEIQAIAAEVGLDPAEVARAAALVPRTNEGALVRLSGGPSVYWLEYSTKGEVPREDLGKLVDAIRQGATHQGLVSEILGSLEWKNVGEVSQIHVAVVSRDGQTSVRIFAQSSALAVMIFLIPGLFGLIGIGIATAVIGPTTIVGILPIVAAGLGGPFLIARAGWQATTSALRRRLQRLMGALSTAVEENVRPAGDDSKRPDAGE